MPCFRQLEWVSAWTMDQTSAAHCFVEMLVTVLDKSQKSGCYINVSSSPS
jgi:hypothetical protein